MSRTIENDHEIALVVNNLITELIEVVHQGGSKYQTVVAVSLLEFIDAVIGQTAASEHPHEPIHESLVSQVRAQVGQFNDLKRGRASKEEIQQVKAQLLALLRLLLTEPLRLAFVQAYNLEDKDSVAVTITDGAIGEWFKIAILLPEDYSQHWEHERRKQRAKPRIDQEILMSRTIQAQFGAANLPISCVEHTRRGGLVEQQWCIVSPERQR